MANVWTMAVRMIESLTCSVIPSFMFKSRPGSSKTPNIKKKQNWPQQFQTAFHFFNKLRPLHYLSLHWQFKGSKLQNTLIIKITHSRIKLICTKLRSRNKEDRTFSIWLAGLGPPESVHELEASHVDDKGEKEANNLGRPVVGPHQGGEQEVGAVSAQDHVPVEVNCFCVLLCYLLGTSGQFLSLFLGEFFHSYSFQSMRKKNLR